MKQKTNILFYVFIEDGEISDRRPNENLTVVLLETIFYKVHSHCRCHKPRYARVLCVVEDYHLCQNKDKYRINEFVQNDFVLYVHEILQSYRMIYQSSICI